MSFDHNLNDKLRHLYRGPRHEITRQDEDGTEWIKLDEIDLTTGRVTRHADFEPFASTPLSEWKPRRQRF